MFLEKVSIKSNIDETEMCIQFGFKNHKNLGDRERWTNNMKIGLMRPQCDGFKCIYANRFGVYSQTSVDTET